ncbi:MAG: cytochrome c oxidase subunit II [Pirellulaceae bacterium]|nr:cytochrome c oxidase subunit II [Pirellulaceae bacterium]
MGRLWSLLFLLVPVLGTLVFVLAMADIGPLYKHWLPLNANSHGGIIDSLFLFILGLTGVIFVGTGVALFWFMWKYDEQRNREPVKFSHGSHTLEVVWSILPAATLVFIAIFQMDAWANAKMKRPLVSPGADGVEGTLDDIFQPPLVEVVGRQFEWRIRYAGKDGVIGTEDDVHTVNTLFLPVNEEIVIEVTSMDVLHSFFLPNMRVKQDLVPGMKQLVWFKPVKTGVFDLVCAELCGWGHYKMRGRMIVGTRAEFDEWLEDLRQQQNQTILTSR